MMQSRNQPADEPICSIEEVGPNVYSYGPGRGMDGVANAGIVVTSEGVLLVDTLMLPRRAEGLRDAIASVTNLPVTHVVNTHFHGDHVFGNQVFVPPARLIAHVSVERTLERIRKSYPEFWARSRPAQREEFARIRIVIPSLTFSKDLTLTIGGREIRLLHFGHGHTSGDCVVYVPDCGIAMTGDLVENRHHPVLRDSIPSRWPQLVRRVGGLDLRRIIPGHGPVGGPDMIDAFDAYLTALWDACKDAYRAGLTVEQAIAQIGMEAFDSWTGDRRWKLPTAIRRCFAELGCAETLDEGSVCECETWAIQQGLVTSTESDSRLP